jgi:hypothetical protein
MSDEDLLSYLFVIDSTQLPLGDALKTIDQLHEVENWQTVLPDAAVLVSRLSIQKLDELIRSRFVGQRYLLTLLERGKKAGWLAKRSWTFMNEPTAVAESEDHL